MERGAHWTTASALRHTDEPGGFYPLCPGCEADRRDGTGMQGPLSPSAPAATPGSGPLHWIRAALWDGDWVLDGSGNLVPNPLSKMSKIYRTDVQ